MDQDPWTQFIVSSTSTATILFYTTISFLLCDIFTDWIIVTSRMKMSPVMLRDPLWIIMVTMEWLNWIILHTVLTWILCKTVHYVLNREINGFSNHPKSMKELTCPVHAEREKNHWEYSNTCGEHALEGWDCNCLRWRLCQLLNINKLYLPLLPQVSNYLLANSVGHLNLRKEWWI